LKNISAFASQSLRTLLLTYKPLENRSLLPVDSELERNLIVIGVAGIKDPLRDDIP